MAKKECPNYRKLVQNPQKAKKMCENATKLSPNLTPVLIFFLEIREFVTKFCRNSPLNFFFKKNPRTIASEWGFVGCEFMCFFWFEAWKISLLKDNEKIVTWNS